MTLSKMLWTVGFVGLVLVRFCNGDDLPKIAETLTPVERIETALDSSSKVEFFKIPLDKVVAQLAETHKVPIILDRASLAAEGIAPDTPITIYFQKVSLRTTVDWITRRLDLSYVIRDEVLQITTVAKSESLLRTKIFSVADIPLGDRAADFSSLTTVITKSIAPDTWEAAGGPGSISAHRHSLVVSQTEKSLHQIELLLNGIRMAGKMTKGSVPVSWSLDIEKRLDSNAFMQFIKLPFNEIVARLADDYAMPILLDERVLRDESASPDHPITIDVKDVSFRAALALILQDVSPELVVELHPETMVITSKSKQRLAHAIYHVGDLCSTPDEIESLTELIMNTQSPETWSVVGGAGACVGFMSTKPTLVIRQTQTGHRDVERFLTLLRRARKQEAAQNPKLDPVPAASQPMVLSSYAVHNKNADAAMEIEKLIRELMPNVWDEEGAMLKSVAGHLVVRHRAPVQRELSDLISKLKLAH